MQKMFIQCIVKNPFFFSLPNVPESYYYLSRKSNHQCDLNKENWIISHLALLDLNEILPECDCHERGP